MKKKIGILLILLSICLTGCGMQENRIRFGAAGVGGMYASFANAYAGLVPEENKWNVEVKRTAGSTANLRLLSDHYIELAIAQMDLIRDAYAGTGLFQDNACKEYQAVAALYPEACQIVVRKDSGITSIDDLQGKTVSVGEAESGTENNATQILQVYGLTELVKTEELNYTDAAKELEEGKIDAMFCTAGIRTLVLEELANKCEVNWLSLEDKQIDKLKAAYPDYSEYEIPAGTYAGQESEVKTVAVQAVLLVSDTMSTERVKELTKLFFEKKKDLQYATSLELPQDEASAVEGVSIPFHPGAAEYYAEHGVIVNSKG